MTLLHCRTHIISHFSGCGTFQQIHVTADKRVQKKYKIECKALNRTVIHEHVNKVKVSNSPGAAHN